MGRNSQNIVGIADISENANMQTGVTSANCTGKPKGQEQTGGSFGMLAANGRNGMIEYLKTYITHWQPRCNGYIALYVVCGLLFGFAVRSLL